jgi:hypothetical protein
MTIVIISLVLAMGSLICEGQHCVPQRPPTSLPGMDSGFWQQYSNWPPTLAVNGLNYNRHIEAGGRVQSFSAALATHTQFYANYGIDGQHSLTDATNKIQNAGQVHYGPFFGWHNDGILRFKAFHYANGFEELHYLTRSGEIVKSTYTDYGSNTFVWVAYDHASNVVAFASGEEDPTKTPHHKTVYTIGGAVKESCEFHKFFRTHRLEEMKVQ